MVFDPQYGGVDNTPCGRFGIGVKSVEKSLDAANRSVCATSAPEKSHTPVGRYAGVSPVDSRAIRVGEMITVRGGRRRFEPIAFTRISAACCPMLALL